MRTPAHRHGESAVGRQLKAVVRSLSLLLDADSSTQGESAVGDQLKAVVRSLSLLLDADSSTQGESAVGNQLKIVVRSLSRSDRDSSTQARRVGGRSSAKSGAHTKFDGVVDPLSLERPTVAR